MSQGRDSIHISVYLNLNPYSFYFLNWDSWFTMLCQSLLYSKVTQLYICILSLFKCFFPLWFITGYSVWFPVLYSRTLFIHSKCDSLHLPNRDSFNISDYRNFSSFILHILSYENEHKIFRFRVKLFPHNIIETHLK